MALKDPVKLARKELGKLGAEVRADDRGGVHATLPNGYQCHISRRTQVGTVRAFIERAKLSLADRNDVHALQQARHDAPFLEYSALEGSAHFTERFNLMRQQRRAVGGDLTELDVMDACLRPLKVVRGRDGRWLYVGKEISVVVGEGKDPEKLALITVQWTKQDLWAAHPRPEKVAL